MVFFSFIPPIKIPNYSLHFLGLAGGTNRQGRYYGVDIQYLEEIKRDYIVSLPNNSYFSRAKL